MKIGMDIKPQIRRHYQRIGKLGGQSRSPKKIEAAQKNIRLALLKRLKK